jgi:hypothetical protein
MTQKETAPSSLGAAPVNQDATKFNTPAYERLLAALRDHGSNVIERGSVGRESLDNEHGAMAC